MWEAKQGLEWRADPLLFVGVWCVSTAADPELLPALLVELARLQKEREAAEEAGNSVRIIFHIPRFKPTGSECYSSLDASRGAKRKLKFLDNQGGNWSRGLGFTRTPRFIVAGDSLHVSPFEC